jgi:hypothetical protein
VKRQTGNMQAIDLYRKDEKGHARNAQNKAFWTSDF